MEGERERQRKREITFIEGKGSEGIRTKEIGGKESIGYWNLAQNYMEGNQSIREFPV